MSKLVEMAAARVLMSYVSDATAAGNVRVDPHFVLSIPGRSALTGEYRGEEGRADFQRRQAALTDGGLTVMIHDVLTSIDHQGVVCTATATRGATSLRANVVGVGHWADGVMMDLHLYPEDLYDFDQFWGKRIP